MWRLAVQRSKYQMKALRVWSDAGEAVNRPKAPAGLTEIRGQGSKTGLNTKDSNKVFGTEREYVRR